MQRTKKNILLGILLLPIMAGFFLPALFSSAQNANNNTPTANQTSTTGAYNVGPVNYDESTGALINLIQYNSIPDLIVQLIKVVMMLIGTIAVIMILVAAFRLAASQGNQTQITAARKTITWAILGLIVALLSYSIVAILQSILGLK